MCASVARDLPVGCAHPSRGWAPTQVTGGVDMEDLGDRIGREARTVVLSTEFRATFAVWSERFPVLARVRGPELLLDLRRSPHQVREDVFAALVTLIREDCSEASLVLLELLRP